MKADKGKHEAFQVLHKVIKYPQPLRIVAFLDIEQ
jgi:hypothetical protein